MDINSYFDSINLKDNVIIISSFDESSTQWSKFTAKERLHLNAKLGYRCSYIAIVDLGKDYVYEDVGSEHIEYNYSLSEEDRIVVNSSGFGMKPYKSEILINGLNYSKQKRGLNFIVYNKKDHSIYDDFYVDFYSDPKLIVQESCIEQVNKKYPISIWGCCASRNLFNFSYLKDIFVVDSYIFQIAPHTLYEQSIDFPESEIDKIEDHLFIKRMVKDDFNKKAVIDFTKRSGGGYCLVDLFCITANEYVLSYNGKSTIIQNWRADQICPYIKDKLKTKGFGYSILDYTDVDDKIIKSGLDKFAELLKSLFQSQKIIIYIPKYADCYVDNRNQLLKYTTDRVTLCKKKNEFVEKYSHYLINLLPGCKVMYAVDGQVAFESISNPYTPAALHFTAETYIKQGLVLLDLLNINYKEVLPFNMSLPPMTSLYHDTLRLNEEYKYKIKLLEGKIKTQW